MVTHVASVPWTLPSWAEISCCCTKPGWPDLYLPAPTGAQAADFSFCLPHLLCMLLPGSYLPLAQSQNIPLATWASSHALLWITQAPTHGSLVSAWGIEEQALLCSAHT